MWGGAAKGIIWTGLAGMLLGLGCERERPSSLPMARAETASVTRPSEAALTKARRLMVEKQLASRDVVDARVLQAMGKVPRHLFIPTEQWAQAYEDYPLPIGLDQTISQPYVVASMTQLLGLEGDERVLEIGTGSGYQAAVLAELCQEVYSIEIIPELSKRAGAVLSKLGYKNIHLKTGDGYRGWPEKAPFDGIMVTAAPPAVPEPLVEQLAPGGKLVIPVGDFFQDLLLIEKTPEGVKTQKVYPVRFVPMTGEAQRQR